MWLIIVFDQFEASIIILLNYTLPHFLSLSYGKGFMLILSAGSCLAIHPLLYKECRCVCLSVSQCGECALLIIIIILFSTSYTAAAVKQLRKLFISEERHKFALEEVPPSSWLSLGFCCDFIANIGKSRGTEGGEDSSSDEHLGGIYIEVEQTKKKINNKTNGTNYGGQKLK